MKRTETSHFTRKEYGLHESLTFYIRNKSFCTFFKYSRLYRPVVVRLFQLS